MLYYAITVKDNIITSVHESAKPITADIFTNTIYSGQDVISVPDNALIDEGNNIAEYDSFWQLKPLSQRVADGYVTVPEGFILDGEEIREMTHEEKITAGLETDEPAPEPIDETQQQIMALKSDLAASDYKIIKSYEYSLLGLEVPYDITVLHTERQAKREEIDNLIKGVNNQ